MLYRSSLHRVLRFSGPDAATFLQSQLTNDVAALQIGGWQWQGLCTAKGRLLATFALVRIADDTFVAVVHVTTIEALAKRLTMFRLRSKLTIELPADYGVLWQFATGTADAIDGTTLNLTGSHAFVVADALTTETAPLADAAVENRWRLANIESMIPEIEASTTEMFVPQMIAWDTVQPGGGVSFSKGCYPGQEIVARAHYRGAVKRHLERQAVDLTDKPVGANRQVTLQDGREAEICNLALQADGKTAALVVVASFAA